MIELNKPIPSNRKGKKFMVYVQNPESKRINTVHFGAEGYSDYTIHKDKKRMERFRQRHKCDPVSKLDKTKPKYWACEYLWNRDMPIRGDENKRGTVRRRL